MFRNDIVVTHESKGQRGVLKLGRRGLGKWEGLTLSLWALRMSYGGI